MRKLNLLLLFFLVACSGFSQSYQLLTSIPLKGGQFTTDHMGNIYHFHSGDLVRYDNNGNQNGIFSSREYGDITSVDVTNPMKVLVVYGDFSRAVVLDKGFAANSSFSMTLADGVPYQLIASSFEGGYWVFDPMRRKLLRLNEQLMVVSEGTDLRQVSADPIEPVQITDTGKWLLIRDKGNAIRVFDRYGTYFKTIETEGGGGLHVRNQEVLVKSGTSMVSYEIQTGRISRFVLPENHPDDLCRIASKRIFILHDQMLRIYKY
jgi:hypothetical protein